MIIRFVSWHYSQTAKRFANPNPFDSVTYYGRPCAYPKKTAAKSEPKKIEPNRKTEDKNEEGKRGGHQFQRGN
jgi:hypothetical protein